MPRIITKGKESPPLSFGPLRLHYQYSVGLPQMHLSFVGVLQGVVVGVLLLGLPLPGAGAISGWGQFAQFLLDQHGYLAYVVTSILILVTWAQYAQNSLYAIWPLSSGQLGLSFLLSVAELLAARTIGEFGLWLVALGAIGVIGGLIRLNNLRLQKQEDFESPAVADRLKRPWPGLTYLGLGILTAACGIGFVSLSPNELNSFGVVWLQTKSAIEWVALALLTVIAIGIAILDRRQRRQLLEMALEDSDLQVSDFGVIRYRDPSTVSTEDGEAAGVVTGAARTTRQQ
jgi:hypothetical protein